MVVVIFRSKLAEPSNADDEAMARELLERARGAPGFVDFRHYVGAEGERLALIW